MSLLKTIKAQLGLSDTPANNFTFDASANNGTMKLARGNAGATTQDIVSVNAAGVVAFPQNPVLDLFVVFQGDGANGACSLFGSRGIANVTKIGTGVYDIYFATPMTGVNYSVVACCDANGPAYLALPYVNLSDTTKVRINTYNVTVVPTDALRVNVQIVRN